MSRIQLYGESCLFAGVDAGFFRSDDDPGVCAVPDDGTGSCGRARSPGVYRTSGAGGGLDGKFGGGVGFAGNGLWSCGNFRAGGAAPECGYSVYRVGEVGSVAIRCRFGELEAGAAATGPDDARACL